MESTTIQNRNNAFFDKIDTLSDNRKQVYNIINAHGSLTAIAIASELLWSINQVSGRLTELAEMFLIKPNGSIVNNYSNCKNTVWTIVNSNDERINLINSKYAQLVNERDEITNDINLQLSIFTKETALKRIAKINKQIKYLANQC